MVEDRKLKIDKVTLLASAEIRLATAGSDGRHRKTFAAEPITVELTTDPLSPKVDLSKLKWTETPNK